MDKKARKSLWSILFVAAMDNFGYAVVFAMFTPLIFSPQYDLIAADTTTTMRHAYLAILFASFSFAQLFGAPLFGDLADQIGRKKALYISIGGVMAGFLLSGVAILLSSFWFLIFSRLFTGFCAGNLSICLAAISDLSPTETVRSRNFGLVTVIWAVSWNIAMLVGGFLSDPTQSTAFSPDLPFWITAALTGLSFLALSKYYTESALHKTQTKLSLSKGIQDIFLALKITRLRPFFVIVLFWAIGWGVSVQWYSTYGMLKYNATQTDVSWGLFLQGLTWGLGGALVNPLLLHKYKPLVISLIGFAGATFLLFLAGCLSSYLAFLICWCAAATFASFALSNAMHLTSMLAPEGIQGKVMGLNQSMLALGGICTPFIGGLTGAINIHFFYPVAAALLAVSLGIIFVQKRKTPSTHTELAPND